MAEPHSQKRLNGYARRACQPVQRYFASDMMSRDRGTSPSGLDTEGAARTPIPAGLRRRLSVDLRPSIISATRAIPITGIVTREKRNALHQP